MSCGDNHKRRVCFTNPGFVSSDTYQVQSPLHPPLAVYSSQRPPSFSSNATSTVVPQVFCAGCFLCWESVHAGVHLAAPSPPSSLAYTSASQQGSQHFSEIPPFLALFNRSPFLRVSECLCVPTCTHATHVCACLYTCPWRPEATNGWSSSSAFSLP